MASRPQQNPGRDPLVDPVRNALNSVHAHFAIGRAGPALSGGGRAVRGDRRYERADASAIEALLARGEQVYIFNEPPKEMNGLSAGPPLHVFQMMAPDDPVLEADEKGGDRS
jgi:hypothetical protein